MRGLLIRSHPRLLSYRTTLHMICDTRKPAPPIVVQNKGTSYPAIPAQKESDTTGNFDDNRDDNVDTF